MSRKAPLSNNQAVSNNGISTGSLGSASGMYGIHSASHMTFKHNRSTLNSAANVQANIQNHQSVSQMAMQVPQSSSISSNQQSIVGAGISAGYMNSQAASQGGNVSFNGNLGIPPASSTTYFRKENASQQQLRIQGKSGGTIPIPQSSMVYLQHVNSQSQTATATSSVLHSEQNSILGGGSINSQPHAHLMKSHSNIPSQSANGLRTSTHNVTSLATIDLMANVSSVTSANHGGVLGAITNTHESTNSRPGSLGGANGQSLINSKKNQSVEINVAGLPKHTSYTNSSGRNTTMNQSSSHLKMPNPQAIKEIQQDTENRAGGQPQMQQLSSTINLSQGANNGGISTAKRAPHHPQSSHTYQPKVLSNYANGALINNSRKNSQDKTHGQLSSIPPTHNYIPGGNSSSGSGGLIGRQSSQGNYVGINNGLPPPVAALCPQDTVGKNRPQTSFRMATKNTFQMMGDRQASSSNIQGSSSLSQQQQLPPQVMKNNLVNSNINNNGASQQNKTLPPTILQNAGGNSSQMTASSQVQTSTQGQGAPPRHQINKENMGYLSNSNGSSQPLTSAGGPIEQAVQQQVQTTLQQHQPSQKILPQETLSSHNAVSRVIESVVVPQGTILDCGSLSKVISQMTEIEKEVHHVNVNYGTDIDEYQRDLEIEPAFNTHQCLARHKVTASLRARMVDWMIEVLTNFKCDDQTFFLAVSLLDRFFKLKQEIREISDLHIIGVTSMFIASKYEDIFPLKMKMVYEKIAHKKLSIEKIKSLEMDILKTIKYRIPAPTSLDFLKYYLKQVLNIGKPGKTATNAAHQTNQAKEKKLNDSTSISDCTNQLQSPSNQGEIASPGSGSVQQHVHHSVLIEKMSLYLAKMALHDYDLQGKRPSLQAVGALYVALKICEQLRKTQLITADTVTRLVCISRAREDEIIEVSQRVLYLAQNFERAFPGLENLKKTHFVNITQLL